ncbi:hypothetical protein X752_13985 [Mesorhizobium sp. LNJC398B00]|nr:hypothetical protein X752_13985 [Mesorhizobium sp. LNJC398B00]ESZ39798.1 hypothetical protein X732_11745 [Mesorhizobium sp. L2C066B000]
MMTASLNEIYDRLGRLTATLEGVSEHLERQDRKSEASRGTMHKRLDDIALRVGYLESDMGAVKTTTTDMKVVTDEVVEWKQRGMGALGVIGIGGAVLGGATVWFWGQILQALRG